MVEIGNVDDLVQSATFHDDRERLQIVRTGSMSSLKFQIVIYWGEQDLPILTSAHVRLSCPLRKYCGA